MKAIRKIHAVELLIPVDAAAGAAACAGVGVAAVSAEPVLR
jgi:hypothetical protein